MNKFLSNKWLKIPVFLACLVPVGILFWGYWHDDLTANPLEYITHSTGDWTIRFLIITLAITPFRKTLNIPAFIRYRRMLGLFAFFYGCLHFTTYLWFDKDFNFHDMLVDVSKRKFIMAGFAGFLLMVPLAVTSTRGWIRRMGGKNWLLLHRLIYFSAIAGVIHYAWLVKSDETKPIQYAVLVGILLLYRIVAWFIGKRRPAPAGVRNAEPTTAETM
jgi:sulfoxide reductase heme-binding subunit YedZ